MFKKVDVNGKNAHPLSTMLKNEAPGSRGGNIGWNFTKFLVNRKGEVVKRYAPMTKPNALTTEIESLLAQAIFKLFVDATTSVVLFSITYVC